MEVKHGRDLKLSIAVGKSRKETTWKNKEITYEQLVNKLSKTTKTYETMNEYLSMNKDDQDRIKDVGGFVGGELKDGKRKNGYVKSRSLVTLDIDFGTVSLLNDLELIVDYSMIIYSTHKHTPKKPRIRLIIPLDRKVSPEEYEAISRKIASEIGMDYFDDTTYEPTRLMFWPSTPKDIDYYFNFIDEEILKADDVLAKYPDWKDCSYWPESSRVSRVREKNASKQGDPLSKEGLIGAFCRTYSIEDAIETFIPEEYSKASNGRYTYVHGSTFGGLVIYEDKFAYSNHSTDPTGGMLCNAFDLVRIHKFHELDIDSKDGTPVNKLPSWTAMMDLIQNDGEVKKTIASERRLEAIEEFDELAVDDENDDWVKELSYNKKGEVESTLNNILTIIKNDSLLHGLGRLNTFNGRYEPHSKLPWIHTDFWSDTDDAGLRWYLEKVYGIEARQKIQDAVSLSFKENSYHPIKEYLESLKWDGENRVERVLIDYLGAKDNEYVKEITRKVFVAAISRIYEPGCKFDYMLTIVGNQGIGKSMLWKELGGAWFSDSLTDIKGKESYEALDGVWIMEMAELSALKKSERESIKQYISKQEDVYRKAYERNVTVNKRQCIFIGTTNDLEFLNDSTGARRFWVVDADTDAVKHVWTDLTKYERDQIWAEALVRYRSKAENINQLSYEVMKEAVIQQESHAVESTMLGLIEEFLKIKVPKDWALKTIEERLRWINATDDFRDTSDEAKNGELVERTKICASEIWVECLGKNKADITTRNTVEINACMSKLDNWERDNSAKRYGPYGTQKGFHTII